MAIGAKNIEGDESDKFISCYAILLVEYGKASHLSDLPFLSDSFQVCSFADEIHLHPRNLVRLTPKTLFFIL
jgi:hypothetical protein